MNRTVERKKSRLRSQQLVLAFLGMYHGELDGIWGPSSIQAKRKFEAHDKFSGGIPSNGMPFAEGELLPHILKFSPKTGKLLCRGMTEEDAKKISAARAPKRSPEEGTVVPAETKASETKTQEQKPQQSKKERRRENRS